MSNRSSGMAKAENVIGATFDSVSGKSKKFSFYILQNMPFYLIGVI
ncbi:hypothetical protein HX871_29115 [Pseudomonas reactans]|uniref:Uncharacterized protein n=1 Tax=Pseudomonas reactans TaxID=117680 RepID=A0ABX2R331_9PSED|nr:hypothetical protein [Pseudomonas reactans]NWA44826.1 hypothetical protein [Pseudomonas reactans]NWD98486.1 hypothetical protein [Pseudomonas reactans]